MSNSWNKNEEKDSLVPLFTTKAPSTWMFLRKSAMADRRRQAAVAADADRAARTFRRLMNSAEPVRKRLFPPGFGRSRPAGSAIALLSCS